MKRVNNKFIIAEIARGDYLYKSLNPAEACKCYLGCLDKIDKSFVYDRCELCRKLGDCYLALDDKDNAIDYYEKYLYLRIPNISVYEYLAYLYFDIDVQKSLEYYSKVLKLNPTLETAVSGKFNAILKSDKFDQKKLMETFVNDVDTFRNVFLKNNKPFAHSKEYNPDRKIHIGYLSGDFRFHAMMTFIRPILLNHNFNRFTVSLYSVTKGHDSCTEYVKKLPNMNFKDCVRLTSKELAYTIYNDKVDILVDLSGYTTSKVFAFLYKPAPVIIEYLGFINTTGMKEIDYVLTDKYTLEEDMVKYYTEKPLYFDTTMQRWLPSSKKYELVYSPEPPYKKNGYFTFGSFNTVAKINDFTIDMWSKILKNVENSKLYIFRTQMTDKKIQLLKNKFAANKITSDRLIFENPSGITNHFGFYSKCDAALDTFPFSGLTITLELCIMGVPVVTLSGSAMHSKGSGRVNKILGLDELIAHDAGQYVEIASNLAGSLQKIDNWRKILPFKLKQSILMNDYKGFTIELENLYEFAYKQYYGI